MCTLCVEGNVPPSEVLYVLEWDDSVRLADLAAKRVSEAEERHADLHAALTEGMIKQMGQVVKAVTNLGKAIGGR